MGNSLHRCFFEFLANKANRNFWVYTIDLTIKQSPNGKFNFTDFTDTRLPNR